MKKKVVTNTLGPLKPFVDFPLFNFTFLQNFERKKSNVTDHDKLTDLFLCIREKKNVD